MKALIALVILMAVFWAGQQLLRSYKEIERKNSGAEELQGSPSASASPLPGLPASLETSLDTARKQGAAGLRNWLINYRIYARDPRLAAIELDYVVLISQQDPAEARRVFKEVQQRTAPSSPVYERVKRLEKTFQ